MFDFKKDLGLKVNDKEIEERGEGGGNECVIHHWGPISFTGRVSAKLVSSKFVEMCRNSPTTIILGSTNCSSLITGVFSFLLAS